MVNSVLSSTFCDRDGDFLLLELFFFFAGTSQFCAATRRRRAIVSLRPGEILAGDGARAMQTDLRRNQWCTRTAMQTDPREINGVQERRCMKLAARRCVGQETCDAS